MGRICLKAPGNYSASIWSYNFSICLCERPKPNIFINSGFLKHVGPLSYGFEYTKVLSKSKKSNKPRWNMFVWKTGIWQFEILKSLKGWKGGCRQILTVNVWKFGNGRGDNNESYFWWVQSNLRCRSFWDNKKGKSTWRFLDKIFEILKHFWWSWNLSKSYLGTVIFFKGTPPNTANARKHSHTLFRLFF